MRPERGKNGPLLMVAVGIQAEGDLDGGLVDPGHTIAYDVAKNECSAQKRLRGEDLSPRVAPLLLEKSMGCGRNRKEPLMCRSLINGDPLLSRGRHPYIKAPPNFVNFRACL